MSIVLLEFQYLDNLFYTRVRRLDQLSKQRRQAIFGLWQMSAVSSFFNVSIDCDRLLLLVFEGEPIALARR
jgi:hypothetical protein